MSSSVDQVSSLDDLTLVVSVSGYLVLLPVVVVGVEWPFVRREVEDYIDRTGTYPVHRSRHKSLHKHHVAIPNIGRRK